MTLSEQLHRNRRSARDCALDDDWVLPFSLWCEVNNFSPATGRRLRKAGKGPVFTQISDRRIGVTVRNNRAWQESRAKSDQVIGSADTLDQAKASGQAHADQHARKKPTAA